ncbi:TIGR03086 family metal-binding protein [Actinoplanes utahensis]|uniref:Mycothiol-dependent maleylpyruvate isomerase metal-binding domain-containing protein n=1 Tax=Actinoplanes utahensis TaxID=1869 RepID=A0A0A6UK38_ACTUT|nr:TIGR03086 family metal-binding protein [Actinoplanes utahensis]KHD76490.1 hypothetical protein MB27_17050 [Actinoplanes utahensis]GIF29803.1 hypothetical protein Aut01nite_27890 [Actinoplanes utahensis]
MPSADPSPAQRHHQIAADFTTRVEGAKDWDAPSPVPGWTARDVVRHLVEWLPGFLAGGAGVTLPAGPGADQDPVQAWHVQRAAVQELLVDPETANRTFRNPHIGDVPLDQAIDRFYTTDVFLHTWDLARATGQDATLDAGQCADLLAGMEPMDAMLRASGQFGPAVPVPADADPQARLIGFIGRDPHWTPN